MGEGRRERVGEGERERVGEGRREGWKVEVEKGGWEEKGEIRGGRVKLGRRNREE